MARDPRGTPQERGYGKAHRQARARWKRLVDSGEAHCCRCGGPIPPKSEFHLDHTADRSGYLGVSHPRCNVAWANKARAAPKRVPGYRFYSSSGQPWSRVW